MMGFTDGDWRLTLFLTASMLIFASFQPTDVRHDGLRGSTLLSIALIALAAAGVVLWLVTR